MTERDQERNETLPPNEFVPGEEDFEEEPEEGQEAEDGLSPSEAAEDDSVAAETAAAGAGGVAGASRRRFGVGRRQEEDSHGRSMGSVRGAHERVHIDDRPSIIFALVCAFGLLGLLAFSYVGGLIPAAAVPTLTPLAVDTGHFTLAPTTSATLAPGASPTASPSPSPTK